MTNSEIFHKAHSIARSTVSAVGNYMIAFSIALKGVYKISKNIKGKLLAVGCHVWEKGNMARIYINADKYASVFGLDFGCYKTGNISWATLHGKDLSNSSARKLIGSIQNSRPYYDCVTDSWVNVPDSVTPVI